MPQFHETGYGKRFFDHQLPALIDAIRDLGQQVARNNVLMEETLSRQEAYRREDIEGFPGLKLVNVDDFQTHDEPMPKKTSVFDLAEKMSPLFGEPKVPADKLITGDPVIVTAKGITGYDVHLGWVKSVNKEDQIIKIEFCETEPGVQLKDRWVPFECVQHDNNRKNRHCTE